MGGGTLFIAIFGTVLHCRRHFETVAREWHKRFSSKWSAGHAETILLRLEKDVFPYIGQRAIAEITPPEILKVLRRIEERSLETAHRVKYTCGQIFRYAVSTGHTTIDPVSPLRDALPPIHNKHMAAPTDPKDIAPLLRMIDGYEGFVVVKCALRLAPLVFVRPGELRSMQWKDVDLEKAEWAYTIPKTGNQHIVPLARQAVAILRELRGVTGSHSITSV